MSGSGSSSDSGEAGGGGDVAGPSGPSHGSGAASSSSHAAPSETPHGSHAASYSAREVATKTPACVKELIPGQGDSAWIGLSLDAQGLRWQAKYEAEPAALEKAYRQKTKSFGFGPRKRDSRKGAFDEALTWLWAKHAAVTKELRPPHAAFNSIEPERWEGVFDVIGPEVPYEGRRVRCKR